MKYTSRYFCAVFCAIVVNLFAIAIWLSPLPFSDAPMSTTTTKPEDVDVVHPIMWQRVLAFDAYTISAFYDDRIANRHLIRVIGIIVHDNTPSTFFCELQYEDSNRQSVQGRIMYSGESHGLK